MIQYGTVCTSYCMAKQTTTTYLFPDHSYCTRIRTTHDEPSITQSESDDRGQLKPRTGESDAWLAGFAPLLGSVVSPLALGGQMRRLLVSWWLWCA